MIQFGVAGFQLGFNGKKLGSLRLRCFCLHCLLLSGDSRLHCANCQCQFLYRINHSNINGRRISQQWPQRYQTRFYYFCLLCGICNSFRLLLHILQALFQRLKPLNRLLGLSIVRISQGSLYHCQLLGNLRLLIVQLGLHRRQLGGRLPFLGIQGIQSVPHLIQALIQIMLILLEICLVFLKLRNAVVQLPLAVRQFLSSVRQLFLCILKLALYVAEYLLVNGINFFLADDYLHVLLDKARGCNGSYAFQALQLRDNGILRQLRNLCRR